LLKESDVHGKASRFIMASRGSPASEATLGSALETVNSINAYWCVYRTDPLGKRLAEELAAEVSAGGEHDGQEALLQLPTAHPPGVGAHVKRRQHLP